MSPTIFAANGPKLSLFILFILFLKSYYFTLSFLVIYSIICLNLTTKKNLLKNIQYYVCLGNILVEYTSDLCE